MAEIHAQLQAEGVVKEGSASMLKGMSSGIGRLYVTKERVVFLKPSRVLLAFGAIGGLLHGVVKPKNVAVDIPRSAITGVERGKFGPNKHIVEISHGEAEPVRFAATPFEEWAAAIQPEAAATP